MCPFPRRCRLGEPWHLGKFALTAKSASHAFVDRQGTRKKKQKFISNAAVSECVGILEPVLPLVDFRTQYRDLESQVLSAIRSVLESSCYINGPDVVAFEAEFASFVGSAHCVGVESGTGALKLALVALDVGPGDEVIVPANTFIACAFAVTSVGAVPRFVDIDSRYLIDVAKIEAAITSHTKAIMPVHLYGQAVDMDGVLHIARSHNLKIIEDASQAHGARYKDAMVGAIGDVGCFSFYPGKNLGAYGDAGCIVTNDAEIAARLRAYREFGQRKKYEHMTWGDNCRLDTLQAAVLRVKLPHLAEWTRQRENAAARYRSALAGIRLRMPPPAASGSHVYHLFVIEVEHRERVRIHLAECGIETGIHYPIPIHLQKAFEYLGQGRGSYPVTEAAASRILSLPIFPEINAQQIERVARGLAEAIDALPDGECA